MIATSPSWRRWWVQVMIGRRNKMPADGESGLNAPDKASTLDLLSEGKGNAVSFPNPTR